MLSPKCALLNENIRVLDEGLEFIEIWGQIGWRQQFSGVFALLNNWLHNSYVIGTIAIKVLSHVVYLWQRRQVLTNQVNQRHSLLQLF